MPSREQIEEKLTRVIDPELRRNIVELGMVRSFDVRDGGRVDVVVSLTTPGCPIRSHFQQAVAGQIGELEDVSEVQVGFDVLSEARSPSCSRGSGAGGCPKGRSPGSRT